MATPAHEIEVCLGFTGALVPALGVTAPSLVALVASRINLSGFTQDFFRELFLHPELHWGTVILFSLVTIAVMVGIVYLVMKIYQRRCKPSEEAPEVAKE